VAIDLGQQYTRPKEGFRFRFLGMKTNATADALPDYKYAYAANVRATRDDSVRTRWGLSPLFPTQAIPVTDIRAYTALGTDNNPRFLAASVNNTAHVTRIYLGQPGNTSALVGTLTNASQPVFGVTMIPFRPAESPSPWMYITNGHDYEKLSSPGAADAVTQQAVGIAEPATACNAGQGTGQYQSIFVASLSYSHAGVAGAVSGGTRISDTVQSAFLDPVLGHSGPSTVGVSAGITYSRGMVVQIVAASTCIVWDVFPGQTNAIAISSIFYFSGTTGRCVIVPGTVDAGPGTVDQSLYVKSLLSSLRRGALIKLSSGPETCLVWSVTEGPDGTICIETSTTGTHTTAETFTQPPAIQVNGSSTYVPGNAITSDDVTFAISGAGIGTQTSAASLVGMFTFGAAFSFQEDDYIHISVRIDTLASLNEFKFLLDVGDGSFTQNFYYYTIRVSDIEAGVQNTLTQLGAAQLVTQRATIDEETAAASNNQLSTASSAQTTPGDGQWAEIDIRIGDLTRVGNDQTRTLFNTVKLQYLFNCSAATNAALGQMSLVGGPTPDTGPSGAPYRYRIRPRSSLTGTKGNPSPDMRYGVTARRNAVTVSLPSLAYDTQIDTADVFRYGGTVTSWRKIGQCASSAATFTDNYSDEAATAGEELEFDNLQPWPTIDVPLEATATSVTGFTAVVTINAAATLGPTRYLPGNLVQLGGINVYTLRQRPTLLTGSSYLFEFLENAGAQTNVPATIYEPQTAQQFLPYMWGPDSEGTVFAVGDSSRPGTLYFAKNYAPDSAPSAYNLEITAPSEPLLGGEVLDGLSFVASPNRWWALYPQPGNAAQRYSVIQQPIPRGLAAPYGHCTDGKEIYFWAKDGIWGTGRGSLTDADLSNLFPRDGVPGTSVTYLGLTVYAPDYSRAATFRLTYGNHYLYAVYQDTTGTYHTLVCDLNRMAWAVDAPSPAAGFVPTCYYTPEQPEGTLLSTGTAYPLTVVGTSSGEVYSEANLQNDDTTPIACSIATREWDGGDIRAGAQWGDLWLDLTPATSNGMLVVPTSLGAALTPTTNIPTAATRQQLPVSLGGGLTTDFLGMLLQWTDDYTQQTSATVLQAWQPSFLVKPELIGDRDSDWYDGGTEGAKFFQGFLLHADTSGAVKPLQIIDGDTLAFHAFTPQVVHNGESILPYSFNQPFIAHTVQVSPTDTTPWRFFDVTFVFEPTPELAETWETQATSFGNNGFSHIQRIVAAYVASAPITLTITAFDGTSPIPVTLPSTGGAYQKLLVVLTYNKGQLYTFAAQSTGQFQLYLDDWEILVGAWGREGAYTTWKSLGGKHGVQAAI
jgi:hypothetical protein